MPTEQRRHMPPFHLLSPESESSFADELRLRTERQVGLLKQGCFPEHAGRFSLILGSKSVASSPLQKLKTIGATAVDQLMDQETPFGLQDKPLGQKDVNLPPSSWRADPDLVHQHDSFSKPLALPPEGRRGNLNGTQYESGLFSSSLPDIFDNKIGLTPKNDIVGRLVEKVDLNHVDDEPFELTKEVEAQIIGDLLPDDDDLLSGVIDDIGYTARANNQDDIDDIFYTGGGMELEADGNSSGGTNNGHTRLNGQLNGEHISGEKPSRILFVRNIDSNVEDSELKFLFEQYGDIHTLNASCKHLGAVMVSYYDVRSAENAMDALQSKLLRRRKLDIHYSLPKDYSLEKYINQGTLVVFNLDPSVTSNDIHRIFGVYGEIKEIHNTSDDCHHKSIEFYDVRAAEAARYALNKSDIAGKQIKLEPSCLGGTKCLTQQLSRELEQGQFGVCNLGSPNSPSACFGSVNMASIKSTGPESGTVQALHSRVHTPIYQFREGQSFLDFPSNTIPSISSPVGIAAAGSQGNHYALDEHSHLPGNMNGKNNGQMDCSFQEISAFHPHSLPEFNNRQSNGVPYNLSTMPAIGFKSNTRAAEAVDVRHIYKGGSGNLSNHSSAHAEALGFSRSGSCHLHGHQLVRSNSFNLHCQPSSPMLWRSTGPFINNIPSRPSMQVHGISRVPSHMIENAIPMNHLHVGSAPAINPSIWDRRHVHATEMMEASGFQPGSAGSMGFPRSPHLHQLEPNSMFPHTGGTFMDPAVSPAHMSAPSQQRGHMFHRRSHMLSSFDSPGEQMRCRRNELSASQSDNKRLYELDIERIVRGEDTRTTLMIKNIPNKYTSKMLLAVIDENHKGTYDFIYLPIDFKNKCNVGYAFINMINPEHIVPFYKTFNGKRWEKFNSEKVASLAYARIQGKSALIGHFQNSSLMNEDKRCRPILFHSDGPNAGDQEPFPVGPNVRTRPGRFRISSCEENHRDVLSVHGKGENPPNRCGDTPGYVTREPGPTSAA